MANVRSVPVLFKIKGWRGMSGAVCPIGMSGAVSGWYVRLVCPVFI